VGRTRILPSYADGFAVVVAKEGASPMVIEAIVKRKKNNRNDRSGMSRESHHCHRPQTLYSTTDNEK
jgi:hypothetical protein